MKREFLAILLFLLLLSFLGCAPVSEDQIVFLLKPGVDTVEVGDRHEDAGAKASIYGFPLSVSVTKTNVDPSKIGMYWIVYQVTYQNLVLERIRYVFVVDETPPSGVLKEGIDTVFVFQEWTDAGIDVTDNSGGLVLVAVEESIDVTLPGHYQVAYVLTDESGNTATVLRSVFVIEDPNA